MEVSRTYIVEYNDFNAILYQCKDYTFYIESKSRNGTTISKIGREIAEALIKRS